MEKLGGILVNIYQVISEKLWAVVPVLDMGCENRVVWKSVEALASFRRELS